MLGTRVKANHQDGALRHADGLLGLAGKVERRADHGQLLGQYLGIARYGRRSRNARQRRARGRNMNLHDPTRIGVRIGLGLRFRVPDHGALRHRIDGEQA